MTYQEECRLRAQMLLDAADGVEFQHYMDGEWKDIYESNFPMASSRYRRKPQKVRHELVVVWYLMGDGTIGHATWTTEKAADEQRDWLISRGGKELKRETVFVEVEE